VKDRVHGVEFKGTWVDDENAALLEVS
jgi:hypothetical protein